MTGVFRGGASEFLQIPLRASLFAPVAVSGWRAAAGGLS